MYLLVNDEKGQRPTMYIGRIFYRTRILYICLGGRRYEALSEENRRPVFPLARRFEIMPESIFQIPNHLKLSPEIKYLVTYGPMIHIH